MKKLLLAGLLGVGLIGIAVFVSQDTKAVKIITCSDYADINYINGNGKHDGLEIELLKATFKRMGLKYKFENSEFKDIFSKISLEKGDIGAGYITAREKMIFSMPYAKAQYGLILNTTDLKKKMKIGYQTEDAGYELLKKAKPELFKSHEFVKFDNMKEMLKKYESKELQGFISMDAFHKAKMSTNKNFAVTFLSYGEQKNVSFLLNEKSNKFNVKSFNEALEATLKEMAQKKDNKTTVAATKPETAVIKKN
jgi:ABC-type amino acid transport substrate-binding protein